VLPLALAVLAFPAVAGEAQMSRMYRWVDDQGVVHYTDQLPPAQVEKGHQEIDRQGITVRNVAPAKSREEIQRDQELERLRNERQRLLEQQNAADRALLRTYRSTDDMAMAREGKLAAIDVLIDVARGNIRRQQEWLRDLRTEAADQERAGKPVARRLTESIEKSVRNIKDAYASIVLQEDEKTRIRADFDRDLERFRQLKHISQAAPEAQPTRTDPVLDGLVTCLGAEQCDRYWGRAVAYVYAHAATAEQAAGPNILIMAPPETTDEFGLILSRIPEKGREDSATIFLDIHCRNQGSDDLACKDGRSRQVLDGFKAAVSDPEGSTPPRPQETARSPVPRATEGPSSPAPQTIQQPPELGVSGNQPSAGEAPTAAPRPSAGGG
jgi:hypothetical protein